MRAVNVEGPSGPQKRRSAWLFWFPTGFERARWQSSLRGFDQQLRDVNTQRGDEPIEKVYRGIVFAALYSTDCCAINIRVDGKILLRNLF